MIKAAIEKLEEMMLPNIRIIDNNRTYSDKQLFPVKEAVVDKIVISTLTGLVDYIKSNVDQLVSDKMFIHVGNHDRVYLRSTLYGTFLQRGIYVEVEAMTPAIFFKKRMDVESFIIQLQSMFVKTAERGNLLKFLGSLKAGFSKEMNDDGVSQTVTAKTGITTVGKIAVPNPVTLQPYRTFSEIEQPASDFVFRIHGGEDEPACALYEADGGAWKLEAIQRVAAWIKEKLPEVAVIA